MMTLTDITAASQIINTALSTFKSVREMAKDSGDSDLKLKLSEAYDDLLKVRELCLDLQEEVRRLQSELGKKEELEGPIPPFGYFYKKGDRENPLCPKCYQSKDPIESFMTQLIPWNGGMRRQCRNCHHLIYEKEMNF